MHKNDPFAFLIMIFMAAVLIFWLSNQSGISPIAANSTVTNSIGQAYGTCGQGLNASCGPGQVAGMKWLFMLIAPLLPAVFLKGFLSSRHDKAVLGEGEDSEE